MQSPTKQKGLPGQKWEIINYLDNVKPIFKIYGVIFVFIYLLSESWEHMQV